MDILKEFEKQEKSKPGYGIQWGIDSEDYDCNLYGIRLRFGENKTWESYKTVHSCQPIIVDGKEVGTLHEWTGGKLFDLMHQSFMVWIDHEPTDEERNNPHFYEDEDYWMRFARLQDMLDYLGIK